MNSISLKELGNLSNSDLARRMDDLLKVARAERNPYYSEGHDLEPLVVPFLQTAFIQRLNVNHQRKVLWMVFDFILQLDYVSRFHGFQNSILDRQEFDKFGWSSPSLYIAYMSQEQASIIGSRVALERLMDLSYFAANARELPKGDSKFGRFREWLFSLSIESDWFYLIPFLPWLRQHDDEFRTAEVHNGSRLKKYVVALQDIPNETKNDAMNLSNILTNLWRYLLILLNDQRPNGLGGTRPSMDTHWLEPYVHRDYDSLTELKERVAEELGVELVEAKS